MLNSISIPRHAWRRAALGYLAVVVYLTLLPFDFVGKVTFLEAWARYREIGFDFSAASARQQWVSNILMFVPLGFFWAAWLLYGIGQRWKLLVGIILVTGVALVVTASVEFLQIWIPNRSPSLTDISANVIGGASGAVGWLITRIPAIREVARQFLHRKSGVDAWLAAYLVTYLFVSLLPLDLIITAQELTGKLQSTQWGWLAAPDGCWYGVRCLFQRGMEMGLSMPLGLWIAWRWRGGTLPGLMLAVLAGALLGLVLEIGQFFTLSGIAEGASVWLRMLGAGLGAGVWAIRDRLPKSFVLRHLRPILLAALPVYLLVAAILILHGAKGIASWESIVSQLDTLRWWPFYYHYFVAEATAIQSVFLHLVLYAFVGLGWWMWNSRSPVGPRPRYSLWAMASAAVVALLLESAKLFVDGLRPDMSAPLLAAMATGGVYMALWWWVLPGSRVSLSSGRVSAVAGPEPVPATTSASSYSVAGRQWWLLPVAVICALALFWPVAGVWLALALAVYSAWLWHRPDAWALVVPAVLPVLFLAPWSGRYFVDEYDLLLAVTALMLFSHSKAEKYVVQLPRGVRWSLGIFVFSAVLSLLLALWPLPPVNVNTFIDYMSPWNGIRVIKGLGWALILYSLLPRSRLPLDKLLNQRFVPGMVLGLAGLTAFLLWERATYPGLFNFQSTYRVTGLFADMHVGGPSIETYLIMGLPFLIGWAILNRRAWVWLFSSLLFFGAVYGLIVTYSRAGYLGFAVAAIVLIAGLVNHALRTRGQVRWLWAAGAMLPLVVVAVLWQQTSGGFAEKRLERIEQDMARRVELWRQGLAMREPGVPGRLVGHGPGSFPGMFQAHNPEGRVPVNLAFMMPEQGKPFLRLGKGDSLYLNQRIELERHADYRLRVQVRSKDSIRLATYVCEKHIKHSFKCESTVLRGPAGDNAWQSLEWRYNSDELGTGPWFARRGIVVSLANPGDLSVVDINRVELLDDNGVDVLRNGDFSQGADHWYFTSDVLDAYRLENQFLEILFDQGWLGLLAFLMLIGYAGITFLRRALRGSAMNLVILASCTGVLTIGLFSSIFWSPRLAMLFYLILLLFLARSRGRNEEARSEPADAVATPDG